MVTMKRVEENDIRIVNCNCEEENHPPSCCICLDVRVGTMLIGLFLLVVYSGSLILASSVFAGRHHLYGIDETKQWSFLSDFHDIAHRHSVDHELVGMVFVCLYFIVVLLLIYGAALRRSSYMLPFFCLQVFDICLTILVAATTITYAGQIVPKINQIYLEQHKEETEYYGHFIRKMSLSRFRLLLVSANLIVLTIKYFMISVVWSFFKYCRSMEDRRSRVEATPDYMFYQGNMDSMIVLPSYEDAVKQKATPPPAYCQ